MSLYVDMEKRLGGFHLRVQFETGGEVLALLGASGCGKSMTLKCIAGVETPDRGRIVLNGRTLFDSEKKIDLPPQKRRVGYLFQQYALFPNMTAAQNIACALRNLPRGARDARVAELVKTFRLEGLEKLRPSQLSGGQQQRVALARIFASQPEALLLDEPFAALDSYLRWQLELSLMDTLQAYAGDVLFVSHSRDEVYRLCQSVCVLCGGLAEPKLPVRDLIDAPATRAAALLSGCKNVSHAKRAGEYAVECLDWGVTLKTAQQVHEDVTFAGYRAHYFDLADGPGENVIECRVVRVIDNIFSVIVMLQPLRGTELLRYELPQDAWRQAEAATVYLHARPESVLLLTGGE
ncbi:MAG: sulfate/molybdate ABC transporter ATP-binding protein [Oscillospiraceae bacterium]